MKVECDLMELSEGTFEEGSKEEQELIVADLIVDELKLKKDVLVIDELELKKDSFVMGELELKQDLVGFIRNLDPFHIHLVGDLTSALSGF
ncbi:hypothetical protein L484_024091 [Morus notabilis]|uniref:Uncharacterized protein n=1 Tax=Morus notabilis TaxID=981085 RepID=W9RPR8_9ROSA|nr:hypothetical protein L484_024091 [Morus notabilis]